jgi:hypothetical protein
MQRVVRKRIRIEDGPVQIAGDVHAVIAMNVGRGRTVTKAWSRQRVVQSRDEKRSSDDR